jgi:hypothetical protein
MLLEGSINRFNLAGVLQFLAQGAATGVLEVRDFEEYGFIYLVKGRVEAISLPITDEKLGTRLMKAGCLTEQQLAEALIEDSGLTHDERKFKPLGQRLIEKGYTTREEIRHIMERQTLDQVFELAHWTNGVFLYKASCSTPIGGSTKANWRASPPTWSTTRCATDVPSAASAGRPSGPST